MTTNPFPLATLLAQLQRVALIARLPDNLPVQELIEIGDALLAAPLFVVEVMAAQADGLAAISEFRRRYGEHLLVGAVVTTLPQVQAAMTAGAHFFTLPALDAKVLRFAREERLFCLSQVKTPVEARLAHLEGCPVVAVAAADLVSVPTAEWPATLPRIASGVDDGATAAACRRAGAVALRLQEGIFPTTDWSHATVITAARQWRRRWEGR